MIWRDSRGRFVRVPKTAIRAVEVAVYPTRNVAKRWTPTELLGRAVEAVRQTVGGEAGIIGSGGYGARTRLASPISFDRLASALESSSKPIRDIDLGGARIWLGVTLVDGRTVPISKAYTRTDEAVDEGYHQLRRRLERYLPEDAEDDEEPDAPVELPPEPIRWAYRDSKGRFAKRPT